MTFFFSGKSSRSVTSIWVLIGCTKLWFPSFHLISLLNSTGHCTALGPRRKLQSRDPESSLLLTKSCFILDSFETPMPFYPSGTVSPFFLIVLWNHHFLRWSWKMSLLLLDCISLLCPTKSTARDLILSKTQSAYFLLILLTNTISICVDWQTENWEWSKIKLFIFCQLAMPFDFSLFKLYKSFQSFAV